MELLFIMLNTFSNFMICSFHSQFLVLICINLVAFRVQNNRVCFFVSKKKKKQPCMFLGEVSALQKKKKFNNNNDKKSP